MRALGGTQAVGSGTVLRCRRGDTCKMTRRTQTALVRPVGEAFGSLCSCGRASYPNRCG